MPRLDQRRSAPTCARPRPQQRPDHGRPLSTGAQPCCLLRSPRGRGTRWQLRQRRDDAAAAQQAVPQRYQRWRRPHRRWCPQHRFVHVLEAHPTLRASLTDHAGDPLGVGGAPGSGMEQRCDLARDASATQGCLGAPNATARPSATGRCDHGPQGEAATPSTNSRRRALCQERRHHCIPAPRLR